MDRSLWGHIESDMTEATEHGCTQLVESIVWMCGTFHPYTHTHTHTHDVIGRRHLHGDESCQGKASARTRPGGV